MAEYSIEGPQRTLQDHAISYNETSKHSSKLSQVYLSILGFYMRTRIDSNFEPHHFAATNTFKDFRDNTEGTVMEALLSSLHDIDRFRLRFRFVQMLLAAAFHGTTQASISNLIMLHHASLASGIVVFFESARAVPTSSDGEPATKRGCWSRATLKDMLELAMTNNVANALRSAMGLQENEESNQCPHCGLPMSDGIAIQCFQAPKLTAPVESSPAIGGIAPDLHVQPQASAPVTAPEETEDSTAIDDSFNSMDVGNESHYDDSASQASAVAGRTARKDYSASDSAPRKRTPKRVVSKSSTTGTSPMPVVDGASFEDPLESPRPSSDVDLSYNATDRDVWRMGCHINPIELLAAKRYLFDPLHGEESTRVEVDGGMQSSLMDLKELIQLSSTDNHEMFGHVFGPIVARIWKHWNVQDNEEIHLIQGDRIGRNEPPTEEELGIHDCLLQQFHSDLDTADADTPRAAVDADYIVVVVPFRPDRATVLIEYKDDPSSYGNDARFKDDVKRLEATLPQKVRQHERERPVRFVDAGAATLIPATAVHAGAVGYETQLELESIISDPSRHNVARLKGKLYRKENDHSCINFHKDIAVFIFKKVTKGDLFMARNKTFVGSVALARSGKPSSDYLSIAKDNLNDEPQEQNYVLYNLGDWMGAQGGEDDPGRKHEAVIQGLLGVYAYQYHGVEGESQYNLLLMRMAAVLGYKSIQNAIQSKNPFITSLALYWNPGSDTIEGPIVSKAEEGAMKLASKALAVLGNTRLVTPEAKEELFRLMFD